VGLSNAERQQRWRERQKAKLAEALNAAAKVPAQADVSALRDLAR
jgi:hypothetical protein